jgi:hypothetical protein
VVFVNLIMSVGVGWWEGFWAVTIVMYYVIKCLVFEYLYNLYKLTRCCFCCCELGGGVHVIVGRHVCGLHGGKMADVLMPNPHVG